MKAQNRKEIFLKALANGEEANIKPLTRQEMLLKKQAERESAGGGGGTLHWDDIEGKPFGGYVEKQIEIKYTPNEEPYMEFSADFSSFEEGDVFTVIFDGVTYENLIVFSDGGSPAIGGEYHATPFYIGYSDGMYGLTVNENVDHAVTIKKMNIEKIDPLYVVKEVVTLFYEENRLYYDPHHKKPVTQLELMDLTKSKIIIVSNGFTQNYPVAIIPNMFYMEVQVLSSSDGQIGVLSLYTAEYTG